MFIIFLILLPFNNALIHDWYVIGQTNQFLSNKPYKISIKDNPISVWKDDDNCFSAISDICPHRGASFARGRIDKKTECIVCPYHTFKYNDKGRLSHVPGANQNRLNQNFNFKTDVPHYEITQKKGWVYVRNNPIYEIAPNYSLDKSTIWIEPEAFDEQMKCVFLSKTFATDGMSLTENSLDILHISEVHSFGNKKRPLPFLEKYERIDEGHVKVTYEYETSPTSLAYKWFGEKRLIVENEYILPHTTIARVKFGKYINTIVTSALPTNSSSSTLFVKAYRNNWVFHFKPLDFIFDKVTESLMDKTISEDRNVLETIYFSHREGNFITKYDELTKLYRQDYAQFLHI
jgi:phenylpropionate dioxygenase-like ring-hydroxylating dioxygenase large terminal subunit